MVIGLAFSSAYKEFLKSHGVNEESMEQFEYQHVLSSQTKSDSELDSLKDQNKTKEVHTGLALKCKIDLFPIDYICQAQGGAPGTHSHRLWVWVRHTIMYRRSHEQDRRCL